MALKLVIGNKAYSSWSMRPWLLLRVLEVAFDEVVIPLRQPDTAEAIAAYSPAGKVPVLIDDDVTLWDSLAIIDHLAEQRPDLPIWPREKKARALARSLSAEMHAGFATLRRVLPMNMRRDPRPASLDSETRDKLKADTDRIEAAWADARQRFADGGDFLFGRFCAADAMFAPVVNRFDAYAVAVSDGTRAYMEAIKALPAWGDWTAGARAEGWYIAALDA